MNYYNLVFTFLRPRLTLFFWLGPKEPNLIQASRRYQWRWQIEVCFKHLKNNGVNIEAMNVQGKEKRHLMMAIAVLAYILAIREGLSSSPSAIRN